MHLNVYFVLGFYALLPIAHAATAAGYGFRANGEGPGNNDASPPVCSADTSDAPMTDFAWDPKWGESMNNCLNQINNAGWNGYRCIPNDGKNNTIGPSFGFYKGNNNFEKNGMNGSDCYNKCYGCLKEGLDTRQAVTTSCNWDAGRGAKCWMGFNYGG